jgi:hypothetical protein
MVIRQFISFAACVAAALVVAGGAGCSSSRGCRTGCGRDSSAPAPVAAAPPHNHQAPAGPAVAPAGPPPSAAARYGGQKTCPVMGDVLGEMGEPIPVVVKGQTVYVCCKGCVAKVQRDPDKYLAIANAERGMR